jgi:hypothetical protein
MVLVSWDRSDDLRKLQGNTQDPRSRATPRAHVHRDTAYTSVLLEEDESSARILSWTPQSQPQLSNETLGASSILFRKHIETQIEAVRELKAAAESAAADVKEAARSDTLARRPLTQAQKKTQAKKKFVLAAKLSSAPATAAAIAKPPKGKGRGRPKGSKNRATKPTIVSRVEPLQKQPVARTRTTGLQLTSLSEAKTRSAAERKAASTNTYTYKHKRSSTSSSLSRSKSSTMPGMERRPEVPGAAARQKAKARQMAMYGNLGNVPDSLLDFVNQAHKIPRLTPNEERELGFATQETIRLQLVHSQFTDAWGRTPTRQEWLDACNDNASAKSKAKASKDTHTPDHINSIEELATKLEEGIRAKDRMVTANLRMVQKVVNLYIRNGLGSEYNAADMMSEGTLVRTLQ